MASHTAAIVSQDLCDRSCAVLFSASDALLELDVERVFEESTVAVAEEEAGELLSRSHVVVAKNHRQSDLHFHDGQLPAIAHVAAAAKDLGGEVFGLLAEPTVGVPGSAQGEKGFRMN